MLRVQLPQAAYRLTARSAEWILEGRAGIEQDCDGGYSAQARDEEKAAVLREMEFNPGDPRLPYSAARNPLPAFPLLRRHVANTVQATALLTR